MKQLWKIIGIAAVAGAVLLGAGWALGANTGGVSWSRNGGFSIASQNLSNVRYTNLEAFNNISINVSSINVRVVQANYFGFEANYRDNSNLRYSFENGNLTVTQDAFNISQVNIMGFGSWQSEEIIVSLPRNATLEDVDIRVSSGRVIIDQLDCVNLTARLSSGNATINNITAQNANINTSSGRIRLETIVVADRLDLQASSGNIDITNATAEIFDIRTTSGRIEGTRIVSNGFSAVAASGNITVGGVFNGHTTVRATSGRIRLNVAGSESNFNVGTSVSSGNVRINGERGRSSVINSNATNHIDARTSSGNINIDFDFSR
ncbi:MAG: DUF4097 domain-containing protein [Defluviitaleaceae bacterium]|nr:DUF4097 domain-containing protein [Defluviitaleaceae bacterium]